MPGTHAIDHHPSSTIAGAIFRQEEANQIPVTNLNTSAGNISRGRLRIFLGYSAGVGKTNAMLQAAHQRKAAGTDVVIAYADTHGRPDLARLMDGFEVLPGKRVEYRGAMHSELNIEAILARRPQLVIVGNLSHANPPGLPHSQRYQDVEELLERGIHVYATLNIYHLESLNDTIFQQTGERILNTVPNRLIDPETEVELVDLPVDELLDRVHAGQFFISEQIAEIPRRFFRKGNLMAMRELCLRWAAHRADDQMQGYIQSRSAHAPWQSDERLMVCISPHPLSDRLVRTGRRLAEEMKAEWYVVYVETPSRPRDSVVHNERIARTLRMAEQLGARVWTITGKDVPETLIRFANEQNITRLVLGRPARKHWRNWARRSPIDDMIRQSRGISITIITDEDRPEQKSHMETSRLHSRWASYVYSLIAVGLLTLAGYFVHPFIDSINLMMVYILTIMAIALFLGRGPSLLASLVGTLSFDYFFLNQSLNRSFNNTQYLLPLSGMLVTSLVVSSLAGRARNQVEIAQSRENQLARQYSLSRDLAAAASLDDVLQEVIRHVSQTLGREVILLLASPDHATLDTRAASQGFVLSDAQVTAAMLAFQHEQPAGRDTSVMPEVGVRFQPMRGTRGCVGVLGTRPVLQGSHLRSDQFDLVEIYSSLAGLAIERALATEKQVADGQ